MATVAAAPATAAVAANRERLRADGTLEIWAELPALLWHQTEEWVWPGGFMPWFNRDVLGSAEDEWPISRPVGLVVNVGLGWGLTMLAARRGMRNPELAATVHTLMLSNAAMHVGLQARSGGYTPGIVTAVCALGPTAVAGLRAVARHPRGGRRAVARGALAGVAASVANFVVMRVLARR